MSLQDLDVSVYKIPNFIFLKKKLIDLILNSRYINIDSKGEKISLSDYNISREKDRNYCDYLITNILNDFIKNFCLSNNIEKLSISDLWFQVYKKGDYHSLHTHPECNFTNIIYVSLPHEQIKTKLFNLKRKQIYLPVAEGDILTFPGYFPHESPINNLEQEKIIISFNSNIGKIN